MARLRVRFIGAGRIADLHALGYRDPSSASGGSGKPADAELHAVCDADGRVAAERAREWGVRLTFTDYREMLADPELDAVEVHVGWWMVAPTSPVRS